MSLSVEAPLGSLVTDLQIRGSLSGDPDPETRRFITIMAISELIRNLDKSFVKDVPLHCLGVMTQRGVCLLAGFIDGLGDLNKI